MRCFNSCYFQESKQSVETRRELRKITEGEFFEVPFIYIEVNV